MIRWGFSTTPKCASCDHWFWYGEMIFLNEDGRYICQYCSEREHMPNIKITAEVNGKQVPLETVSTETFEAIKALTKPKEIPVARLVTDSSGYSPCLLFKPTCDLNLGAGWIHCLDLKTGISELHWGPGHDKGWIEHLFKFRNIQPL